MRLPAPLFFSFLSEAATAAAAASSYFYGRLMFFGVGRVGYHGGAPPSLPSKPFLSLCVSRKTCKYVE